MSKSKIFDSFEKLIGDWETTGTFVTEDQSTPITITGTDKYEWFPGKKFLIHTADVMVGEEKIDVIEIIGDYNEAKDACAMHAFQNDGNHDIMWAKVIGSDEFIFEGDDTRATLTIHASENTMSARWERLHNDKWIHWMDMSFRKK